MKYEIMKKVVKANKRQFKIKRRFSFTFQHSVGFFLPILYFFVFCIFHFSWVKGSESSPLVHRIAEERGIDVSLIDSVEEGDLNQVQRLVEDGADLELRDHDGGTLLHVAARYNRDSAIIEFLLNRGADHEARDNDGWTPFNLAVLYNSERAIAQLLLEE